MVQTPVPILSMVDTILALNSGLCANFLFFIQPDCKKKQLNFGFCNLIKHYL